MPSVAWQSTLLTLSWQDFKLHTLWSFPFLQHKEFMVMAFDHFVLRKGEAKSTILSGHTHILQQTHTVTVLLHDWENKQHTLHFLRENDNMHNISCVLVLALSHAADPIQSWWAGPLWSKNKYEEPYKPYYIKTLLFSYSPASQQWKLDQRRGRSKENWPRDEANQAKHKRQILRRQVFALKEAQPDWRNYKEAWTNKNIHWRSNRV